MPRAETMATLAAPPFTSAKSVIITTCIDGSVCSGCRRRVHRFPSPLHHASEDEASSQGPIGGIDCRADNVVQRLAGSLVGLLNGRLCHTVLVLPTGPFPIAPLLHSHRPASPPTFPSPATPSPF